MESSLEKLQVVYQMVFEHLKDCAKQDNDVHVRIAINVLCDLNKRIEKLKKKQT